MPLIFATPMGMPLDICFLMWPIRWVVAYFIVNLIVHPLSLKLAGKLFDYKLGMKTGLWNPLAFFISLMMSFIMPLIFGVPNGQLSADVLFYMWPVRWVVAYFIVSQIVNPVSFKLAVKILGFNPMK